LTNGPEADFGTGTRKIVDKGVGQIKVSKVGQIKLTNPTLFRAANKGSSGQSVALAPNCP